MTVGTIVAQLYKSNQCEAEGLVVTGNAPVLGMCRKLIEAGYDPAHPLHAYRGDVLGLTVSSIGWGADYTIKDNTRGTPALRRFRDGSLGVSAASPIAPEAVPVPTCSQPSEHAQ